MFASHALLISANPRLATVDATACSRPAASNACPAAMPCVIDSGQYFLNFSSFMADILAYIFAIASYMAL